MKTETTTRLEAKVDLALGLLHDLRQQVTSRTDSTKQWLSTAEVGQHVGRSARTIANWVQQGRFPEELIRRVKRGDSYVLRLKGQAAITAAEQILIGEDL
jgi:predicted DNA-binding transcriptional regulator AlpA